MDNRNFGMYSMEMESLTLGGRPIKKIKNPSSSEISPMDSQGKGQLLLDEDPLE